MATLEQIELNELKTKLYEWGGDALPLVEEVKAEVTAARLAMDSDPPDLYALSNSLVDLSILNIRLIDRITNAKMAFNEAKYIYESHREGWKVKLVQGYTVTEEVVVNVPKSKKTKKVTDTMRIDGVAAGVADSMKVGLVKEEYKLMNEAEKNYLTVQLLRSSVEKSMDAIRSKLSYESKHET